MEFKTEITEELYAWILKRVGQRTLWIATALCLFLGLYNLVNNLVVVHDFIAGSILLVVLDLALIAFVLVYGKSLVRQAKRVWTARGYGDVLTHAVRFDDDVLVLDNSIIKPISIPYEELKGAYIVGDYLMLMTKGGREIIVSATPEQVRQIRAMVQEKNRKVRFRRCPLGKHAPEPRVAAPAQSAAGDETDVIMSFETQVDAEMNDWIAKEISTADRSGVVSALMAAGAVFLLFYLYVRSLVAALVLALIVFVVILLVSRRNKKKFRVAGHARWAETLGEGGSITQWVGFGDKCVVLRASNRQDSVTLPYSMFEYYFKRGDYVMTGSGSMGYVLINAHDAEASGLLGFLMAKNPKLKVA